jgi:hypothetical protein
LLRTTAVVCCLDTAVDVVVVRAVVNGTFCLGVVAAVVAFVEVTVVVVFVLLVVVVSAGACVVGG